MAFDPTSTVSAVAGAPSMSEAGPASLITTGLWFAVIVFAKRNVDDAGGDFTCVQQGWVVEMATENPVDVGTE